MKAISCVAVFVVAGAIPGFCQAPRRSLSAIFNSKLAFYLPEPDSVPVSTGVLNAGSGSPTIAPNTFLAIYGTNLAQQVTDWSHADFSHGLPTTLGGVTATVNNQPAAVSFISPNQVNILAPIDTHTGTVSVTLTTPFGTTAVNPTEQSISPAFFVDDPPNGHVAGLHYPSYGYIGPTTLYPGISTPATPGETVVLYCTGFGQTNPPITNQLTGAGPLPTLPTVTIGNLPANVIFAGLSSAGLYQLNVIVPTNAPDGDLALVATYNGVSTQSGVVLTVHH